MNCSIFYIYCFSFFLFNSFSFFVVLVWFECGKDLFKSSFFFFFRNQISMILSTWFKLKILSKFTFSLNISQQRGRSEHYYQKHEAIPSVKNYVEKVNTFYISKLWFLKIYLNRWNSNFPDLLYRKHMEFKLQWNIIWFEKK